MIGWRLHSRRMLRRVLFHTPLRRFLFPRFQYSFSPRQLARLVWLLDEALAVPGEVIEVGCFVGATTVMLDRHVLEVAPERRYFVVDTFSGFNPEDVATEVRERGKSRCSMEESLFAMNSPRWFAYTMELNQLRNVEIVQADVNRLDFASLGARFAFALIDVDLKRPVGRSLEQVLPLMNPGGVIVVDDCRPNGTYDGALEAFAAFVQHNALDAQILDDKLGVIRVPQVC